MINKILTGLKGTNPGSVSEAAKYRHTDIITNEINIRPKIRCSISIKFFRRAIK